VWTMARRNHITLPVANLDEWKAFYSFRDFNHFVEVYLLTVSCMRTPGDYALMVESFAHRQAQQNIKYCEVFLSATFLLDKLPVADLLDALAEGVKCGEELYGTRILFIPDIAREQPQSRHRVLDFVLEGQRRGLFIGLGLGGIETGFPPELFEDVFGEARRQGLHLVAHAGETAGPASVWGALRALHAERIGHGVRSLEDEELIAYLRSTHVPLEVSPASNYRLHVVAPGQPHPIRRLVDGGVYVTVNSDDPSMFSTSLNDEYLLLARQGFTWPELWQLNLNALEAAFLSEADRAAYRATWQAFLDSTL
ncbi:MAG: adenosine deaminase, partial [Chloroflexota bacterium]|nr:adenosine deaminase [Chloroflexota bacterium]